jgi:hypothetical protein
MSDSQLLATARQYDSDFDEMRSAGETDEADILYQRAMLKVGAARGKGKNGVEAHVTFCRGQFAGRRLW